MMTEIPPKCDENDDSALDLELLRVIASNPEASRMLGQLAKGEKTIRELLAEADDSQTADDSQAADSGRPDDAAPELADDPDADGPMFRDNAVDSANDSFIPYPTFLENTSSSFWDF